MQSQFSSKPNSEKMNVFFNERVIEAPMKAKEDEVYKNYIIKQNNNIYTENKKLISEKFEIEKKYEELEEEHDTTEKRFNNTKNFLKSFRFINDALSKIVVQYEKNNKDLHMKSLINYFRLILGLTNLFLMLGILFGFSYFLLIPLQIVFTCGFHEFFVPYLTTIEQKRISMNKLKLIKDNEVKEMNKTMDIISEFIDNAL